MKHKNSSHSPEKLSKSANNYLQFKGEANNPGYSYLLADYLKNPVVHVELNSKCNFHCDYCRSPQSPRQKSFMDKDLYIHILKQLKEITTKPLRLHVDGEPTLHPAFLELALMANKAGHDIALATNGSALKPQFLDIRMTVVLNLSCSAEELRLRSGMNFQRYLDKITHYLQLWKQTGRDQAILLKVYTSAKEHQSPALIDQKICFTKEFLEKLGFDSSKLQAGANNNLEFSAQNRNGAAFYFQIIPRTEGGCYPSSLNLQGSKEQPDFGFCDSPWKTLAILSDGTITYCCVDLFGETGFTKPHEIWEASLKDIWLHHPKLVDIRSEIFHGKITLPVCRKCLEVAQNRELYVGW
jgi:organic radical activating enzyme